MEASSIKSKNNLLSKQQIALMMAALIMLGTSYLVDIVYISAANGIYEAFPQANIQAFNLAISGTSITYAIVALLCAYLVKKVDPKILIVLGFATTTVTSIMTTYAGSMTGIMVLRLISGLGQGLSNVPCFTLINSVFKDEQSRSTYTGIFTGGNNLMGAILSYSTGVLIAESWTSVRILFFIMVPMVIFTFFVLPSRRRLGITNADAEEENGVDAAASDTPAKTVSWGALAGPIVSVLLVSIAYLGVYYNIALVLAERGFSDTKTVGTVTALIMIVGIVSYSSLGLYYVKLKKVLWLILIPIVFVSILLIAYGNSTVIIYLGALLLGFGYDTYYGYSLVYMPFLAPDKESVLVSLLTFMMGVSGYIGMAMMPFVSGLLGKSGYLPSMPTMAGLCVVALILEVVTGIRIRKNM